MFITIQGLNINSDSIKDFTVEDNTLIITDPKDDRSIFFYKSKIEAKQEELRILNELNNEREQTK